MIKSANLIVITAAAAILSLFSCKKADEKPQTQVAAVTSITNNKQVFALGCSSFKWVRQVEENAAYQSLTPDGKGNIYTLHCVFKRKFSGIYIIGHVLYSSTIEKVNATGKIEWFYQPLKMVISQIKADDQGNIYALTLSRDDGNNDGHGTQKLQKISPTGHLIWQTEVGGHGYGITTGAQHTVTRFAVDGPGNTILAGNYNDNNGPEPVVFGSGYTVRGSGAFTSLLSANGSLLGVKTDPLATALPVDTIAIMGNGNTILLGNHNKGNINQLDIQLYNKAGNRVLTRSINTGDPFVEPYDLSYTASGDNGFIYTGHHIFKFDANGNMLFKFADTKPIVTTSHKRKQVMAADSKGTLYLGRTSKDSTSISIYTKNGTYAGSTIFNGATVSLTSLLIDKQDQLYLGGSYIGGIQISYQSFITRSVNNYPLGLDTFPSFLFKYALCN